MLKITYERLQLTKSVGVEPRALIIKENAREGEEVGRLKRDMRRKEEREIGVSHSM